jgi:hypothetical protein
MEGGGGVISVGTYKVGPQEWMKGSNGMWYVRMWGWWPGNTGRPSWQWKEVDRDRVPAELIARERRDSK